MTAILYYFFFLPNTNIYCYYIIYTIFVIPPPSLVTTQSRPPPPGIASEECGSWCWFIGGRWRVGSLQKSVQHLINFQVSPTFIWGLPWPIFQIPAFPSFKFQPFKILTITGQTIPSLYDFNRTPVCSSCCPLWTRLAADPWAVLRHHQEADQEQLEDC